jgi:transposase-like protein
MLRADYIEWRWSMGLARIVYSRELKISAMRAMDAGETRSQVARRLELSPKLLGKWRLEWRARGESAFPGKGNRNSGTPPSDERRLAELERKIGQLTVKSVDAFQGASPASRRQWRGCLFGQVKEAAKAGGFVKSLCATTQMSRAGYYRCFRKPEPQPEIIALRDQIQKIALTFPAYGYRRITEELDRRGYLINHKRVLRLMRQDNLLCLRKKSFLRTTNSAHPFPVFPNVAATLRTTAVNQLWVADITYIRLRHEFSTRRLLTAGGGLGARP